jgi:ribonuclease P protein component
MLASKYRLKKKINFARIEIDGKMLQSKSFGMGMYNREDTDPSRFGFIISTKISKKAVIRNRIKRTMSETVRKSIQKIVPGYDVLFLIKSSITKLNDDQIAKETYEIITKNLQSNTISNS